MGAMLFGFGESRGPASRLAADMGIGFSEVEIHHFPDGESLVKVDSSPPVAILYRSLDYPNAKLIELLLAASALRENGALRVFLVAPYLCYMRQDTAFLPGQAISQRVIGKFLAEHFEGILTVDAHLHRIRVLAEVMPGIEAVNITAAPVLSATIDTSREPLIVGPDAESRQWVEAIAGPLGCDIMVGEKTRKGDRQVEIWFENIAEVSGRHVALVDDVISSGTTLALAGRLLREAGAASVEVLATHCLASSRDLAELAESGISRIRATDSVPGPMADIRLSGLLAGAIRAGGWTEKG